MQEELIGNWVRIELTSEKTWIGKIEEWDEDAIFISNGIGFGQPNHKGAECTNDEVAKIEKTDQREFSVS